MSSPEELHSRGPTAAGSRLYEVDLWMWRYGRGYERKVPVLEAMEERAKRVREALPTAGETRKRRRLAEKAAANGAAVA